MHSNAPNFSNVQAASFGGCTGASDMIAPADVFVTNGEGSAYLPTFRNSNTGQWNATWTLGKGWVADTLNFGGANCRSIPADYDGDTILDRATLCDAGEFRIAYSGYGDNKFSMGADGLRHVQEMPVQQPLPAYVYPGGVSFQDIKAIFETVDYLCPTVAPGPSGCTIDTMSPIPIGPYFPQCVDAVNKQYTSDPCADPLQKVACEVKRIQQAQCVWQ
jgi:hypothetical protein